MHTAVIAVSLNRVDEWFLAKAFLIGCLGTFGMNLMLKSTQLENRKWVILIVIVILEEIRMKELIKIINRQFTFLFNEKTEQPPNPPSPKHTTACSLLDKIDNLQKQEEKMVVLNDQLNEPIEQFSVI